MIVARTAKKKTLLKHNQTAFLKSCLPLLGHMVHYLFYSGLNFYHSVLLSFIIIIYYHNNIKMANKVNQIPVSIKIIGASDYKY